MTLRVLHVVPSVGDAFGGLATSVAGYGPIEHALGHQATVVALDRPEHGTSLLPMLHRWYDVVLVPPGRMTGRYHGGWHMVRALRALIPRHDLMVMHSVFSVIGQVGYRVAGAAGVPYLLLPHGSLDPHDLTKHALAKRALAPLWRSALAGASALVCTTARESERLHTYGVRRPCRIGPNNPVAGSTELPDRAAARRRAGLPDTARIVLFLGRLVAGKGIRLLLDGFAAGSRPGDLLLVAGRGERGYERRLHAHAGRLAARDQVRFVGWVSGAAKADLLAGADLLALPSAGENFGNVVVEALGVGTPVLLSPEVFLADELVPAHAAAVCDRTPDAVGRHLRWLLDDADTRLALAAAGQHFVAERLSLPAVAARYHQVVAEVLR
jgi:glycosyltransferase involved in cell wall biosynthesis